MVACKEGKLKAVETLLREGKRILSSTSPDAFSKMLNLKDSLGRTAVFFAARFGYYDILHSLVETGASADIDNDHKDTPLITAVQHSHFKIAEFLMEKNADVSWMNQVRAQI